MAERITVTEREPDPGQQWKCGDEFLPFHPQASHVPAEYRDGWNRCYWMAVTRGVAPGPAPKPCTYPDCTCRVNWDTWEGCEAGAKKPPTTKSGSPE